MEKMGFAISCDVAGLIAEACIILGLWELLDVLIAQGLISGLSASSAVLVEGLIKMNRADLLCRFVKDASDIQSSELLLILKYFLSPPKDSKLSLVSVRKEWEKQAMLSIDRAAEAAAWGLEACKWVPSIEVIRGCLGSVLDEQLLYLTLYSELHEELRSMENLVRLFTVESCEILNYN